jgi:capsular exopolysaccharide synthesis family protein
VQQNSEGLSLEQILGFVRRRLLLIVLCVLVVAGAAYAFSKRQTREYTASSSLVFSDGSLSRQIAGLPASVSSGSSLLAQQANDLELVRGGDTAAKTASAIGNGVGPGRVAASLEISGHAESGVVTIASTTTSPVLAAKIANTYARVFVNEQQEANSRYFKAALALVHRELAHLSSAERVGAGGVQLQDRAQTLSLLSELHDENVQVAQEASVPSAPSAPKTKRNTALGALLGLLIGLGLAFALGRLDRRLRGPEDLEAIYGLPLLGAVPESMALSRAGGKSGKRGKRSVLPVADAAAFSLIRAHLRFFNVDRELRTLIIASAAPGDGKTTIARHLAEAAARLGTRVLLLEADLRDPTLAEQLDVTPGPGLADVLIGATPMREAIQSVHLEAPPGEGAEGRVLDVLVAGAVLPPNPGELIEGRAMGRVLEQAKLAYDLVVIDTPPLSAVSDAFPLLTKVDGVVIVGWIGRSRRDASERLHHVLASAGAPLLGVIANGSSSGGPAAYGYTKGEKPSPAEAAPANEAARSELVPSTSD